MSTVKKLMVLSFCIGVSLFPRLFASRSLFDEMLDEMNEMQMRFEQRVSRLNEEMKKGFVGSIGIAMDPVNLTIVENPQANSVDIVLSPVQEKNFEAVMDQNSNMLTITTPVGTLTLQTEHHVISAGFNHQVKKEVDQKGNKQQVMMSSFNQSAKKVSNEMALEETRIEYDQAAEKLTIVIPFRKKSLTKIPISIKESAHDKQGK